jgi:hypothetical protein
MNINLFLKGVPCVIIDVIWQEEKVLSVPIPCRVLVAGIDDEGEWSAWCSPNDLVTGDRDGNARGSENYYDIYEPSQSDGEGGSSFHACDEGAE